MWKSFHLSGIGCGFCVQSGIGKQLLCSELTVFVRPGPDGRVKAGGVWTREGVCLTDDRVF